MAAGSGRSAPTGWLRIFWYTNNGLLYFHTELKNTSNIAFDIDYVSFKIVD
ncbi:MAG: DUF4138 domain-containing protein, partial [Lachnospiraceae bacterium]|nr:DUF4138 domain-containing protein [Lachnospiraceae bacterium]